MKRKIEKVKILVEARIEYETPGGRKICTRGLEQRLSAGSVVGWSHPEGGYSYRPKKAREVKP
jgi:hypothetical protein